jgi:hypothetical protein
MKPMYLSALSLALLASPAMALKITNLDKVEHRVALDERGSQKLVTIAPGRTEYLMGVAGGTLSLVSAPPKRAKGRVEADGVLSGIVGEGRNSGIPADNDHSYTIWPGGKLFVQGRMKRNGYR